MTEVDFDEGEIQQDFGKLPLRSDPKMLRGKNYEVFSDGDSIGLDEITDDYDCQGFDPDTLSYWKTPDNCEKLVADNLNKVLQIQTPLIRPNLTDGHVNSVSTVKTEVKIEEGTKVVSQLTKNSVNSTKQDIAQAESYSEHGDDERQSQPQQKVRRPRKKRIRNSRRQTYPLSQLQALMKEFSSGCSQQDRPNWLTSIAARQNLNFSTTATLFRQWQSDPQLRKYFNREQEPLGALIDGKRERTLQRIKLVKEMLQNNPYLTHKEISDRLFQRNRSKKKVMRSAIIRIMKIEGYMRQKLTDKPMVKLTEERHAFISQMKRNTTDQVYYLDECLFHRYLYRDCFWTLDHQQTIPTHSSKFVAESMVMVALMCPDGALYWQIRGGNYSTEDYAKLIKKIFNKVRDNKNSSLVILRKSELRGFESTVNLVKKEGFRYKELPDGSDDLSPLQGLFAEIRRKVRRLMLTMPEEASKHLCGVVNSYSKEDLQLFIEDAKKLVKES